MAKSYCVNYPNCSSLKGRLGITQAVLNAKINAYNMNLASGETKISSTTQYTEEQLDEIYKKLADKQGTDVNSFEVKSLMGEYDFVAKQLYQMDDVRLMMLDIAKEYCENETLSQALDGKYGSGVTKYIGEAIKAFYA